ISTSFRTKFYGSLDAAFQKFGRELFDRAEIVPTHSQTEEEFLSSVDFWVYYPNSRLTDQIWEPALVAMASGKVVIMSPLLRWLYGDAAVYAEHEEVTSIINEISSNPEAYMRQANLGQEFVRAHHNR